MHSPIGGRLHVLHGVQIPIQERCVWQATGTIQSHGMCQHPIRFFSHISCDAQELFREPYNEMLEEFTYYMRQRYKLALGPDTMPDGYFVGVCGNSEEKAGELAHAGTGTVFDNILRQVWTPLYGACMLTLLPARQLSVAAKVDTAQMFSLDRTHRERELASGEGITLPCAHLCHTQGVLRCCRCVGCVCREMLQMCVGCVCHTQGVLRCCKCVGCVCQMCASDTDAGDAANLCVMMCV